MKLKEIHRTSTFAWSPTTHLPLLATGTVAGALDESFSNESQLEIWTPDFLDKDEYELGGIAQNGLAGFITDTARFNRLAWGAEKEGGRTRGVIAAGMENGELVLWDPAQILAGAGTSESLILRNTIHTGPVRGLDFNPLQTNLLASGGVNGEVYIWDLKDPSKPYTPTPGARSNKLDEMTSIAWNQQVQYVLAGASSTGYTVVWDLRGKREVVALAYGGGAGTLAGQMGTGAGLAVGGRRGMSDIAWHPDNATRVVTASEDDSSPVIMVWDLRNARAPEKILTGHEKGVLSLSWCKQDADLLLSCGKDNRALCWNPQTSEIIGEIPSANNWAFQVDWCPRNPDLLATASFDGTVGIHSIQSTNEGSAETPVAPRADGADIFDAPSHPRSQGGTLSLKQPPKWLRRPVSSSFGFGGKLLTVSNLPSAQGKNQSSVVHIRSVVTEDDLVDRATKLQKAIDEDVLQMFAEEKSEGGEGWKALLSLFKADSREELVTLLGFSKAEIAARVAEAVETLKTSSSIIQENTGTSDDGGRMHEPVVSFAEPTTTEDEDSAVGGDTEPSEFSASVTSDATSGVPPADSESTTTAPSLFGDDGGQQAETDFFSTIGRGQEDTLVPHTNYGKDSSVAATIGSRPSSVASESQRSTFRIYPEDESDVDRLVTKAIVLGDFESAVALCLSADRFADAILLAVKGGPALLERTQKAYFDRRTGSIPYLRLFQSIVTNDLSDIVQNADLQEWQEIFVVLCTFASKDEFSTLAEQLGARLEEQFNMARENEPEEDEGEEEAYEAFEQANEYRKNATLTYLAAARLERLVGIWSKELVEEEVLYAADEDHQNETHYSAHAYALQVFIEKVTVFRSATKYQDPDLASGGQEEEGRVFKLAGLYDRYAEYADLLASQGLLKEAAFFLALTPSGYAGSDLKAARERLLTATGRAPAQVALAVPAQVKPAAATAYGTYSYPSQPTVPAPAQQSLYTTYAPTVTTHQAGQANPYAPAQTTYQTPSVYQPTQTYAAAPNNLTQPPHMRTQPQPVTTMVPPPLPPGRVGNGAAPPPGPPPVASGNKRDAGGWNDAPLVSRSPAQLNLGKPSAITSPFPNAVPTPLPGASFGGQPQHQQQPLPPPPRPGSVNRQGPPPPPPPMNRPPSVAGQQGMQHHPPPPPPGRMVSPLQGHGHQPQPTPSQYAPPPQSGAGRGQTPPPPGPGQYRGPGHPGGLGGPYARATPPPQQGPPGPYGPPPTGHGPAPGQLQPSHPPHPPPPAGPYAPPPQQQHHAPQQGMHPPHHQQQQHMQHQQPLAPPPTGPYAPPPGAQRVGPPQATSPQAGHMQGGPHHPPPPPGPGGVGAGPGQGGPPPPSAPPARAGPPPPKYPPGDRSHIPDSARPIFNVLSEHLNRAKQTTPPQQKRLVDDLERRINPLFDALNCETLSQTIVEQLLGLVRAMEAHDRPVALAIHVDILTRSSQTDDIALWMSGVKQLILRI